MTKRIIVFIINIALWVSLAYTVACLIWSLLPVEWSEGLKEFSSKLLGIELESLLPIGLTGTIGVGSALLLKHYIKNADNQFYRFKLDNEMLKNDTQKNMLEAFEKKADSIKEIYLMFESIIEKNNKQIEYLRNEVKMLHGKTNEYKELMSHFFAVQTALAKKNMESKLVSNKVKEALANAVNNKLVATIDQVKYDEEYIDNYNKEVENNEQEEPSTPS